VIFTDRPARCPNCGHELAGRSTAGRCPACPFEFDEHTRVFCSEQTWARLALGYATAGLVAGVVISALYWLNVKDAPYPALPLLLGLVAPALGLALRRSLSGRITGRFVALTPPGILVGTRPAPRLVPWDDFEQLTEQRGVLRIRCRDEATLIPLDDIFAGPAEVAAFEQAVLQAARRYRSMPRPRGAIG
jgi:hypothetical protein